ncbi:MAG: hypothetical protein OQK72_04140 [Gammaproteobacteria bacterium]|nr:hypothetical protein [Gammaproteobacteria bacterium]MCW9003673.1 hypothetical protein [Gammaproteobacteria bacterium]MCW9055776.1 hypothetical protein [Gammaproteobacteria bacterium]
MIQELDNLIQEVIDFGNVISYAEDPEDINFQQACNLFNDYLNWKLEELKEQLKTQGSAQEIQWTVNELAKLVHLIEQPEQTPATQTHWFKNLFQHCADIQQNKIAAI